MKDGFVRIAAGSHEVTLADPQANAKSIVALMRRAAAEDARVVVTRELGLTGYTLEDLFEQQALLDGATCALGEILRETSDLDIVAVVGLPLAVGTRLYNAAAVILRGTILGVALKTFMPGYREFYEPRRFSSGEDAPENVELCGQRVPMGNDLVFTCQNVPGLSLGVEICEDLWVPVSPGALLALGGATVLLNPSASDEAAGKTAYRRSLVKQASAQLIAAYAYAGAASDESSTDMVFGGHLLIAENGTLLAENPPFAGERLVFADIDLMLLTQERRRMVTFHEFEPLRNAVKAIRHIPFTVGVSDLKLRRKISPLPFVPDALDERCAEIFSIQVAGLARRLSHTKAKTAVLPVSGGVDSTLALLVIAAAFQKLGWETARIVTLTMPGPGTTDKTRSLALALMEGLGTTTHVIPIHDAVAVHLRDIGHQGAYDITYENAQARERTQIGMDFANKTGGLLIGTGDLSELALGWATYGGDHISMYGVNASVPKTLVRHLIRYAAQHQFEHVAPLLLQILDLPVSPELIPGGIDVQKTENTVGPYELHDFFIYYGLRYGFSPTRVLRLCCHAFSGTHSSGDQHSLVGQYDRATILRWMKEFYRRFFAMQFKRSCLPDGPKVGFSFSPRGDWRMPSDASAALWLRELEGLEQ